MQPDEALGAFGSGHQLGDGNGRSVRGEDGLLLYDVVHRSVHLSFLGNIFNDGLNNDVAMRQIMPASGAFQSAKNFLFLLLGDAALFRRTFSKLA